MAKSLYSFHKHLLRLHVIAVHQAHHIDTGGEAIGAEGNVAVDGLAADHATRHVDHLQGSVTHVADHPFAAVEEGEVAVFLKSVGIEHEAEAVGIVGRVGLEAVARSGKQVDVGASHVVDEVEVVHLHVLGHNAEGVGAVFGSLKADGHLRFGSATDDGVIFVAFGDIDLSAIRVELELAEHGTIVEADDGIVEDSATVARHLNVELADYLGASSGGEVSSGIFSSGLDEHTFHDIDLTGFR